MRNQDIFSTLSFFESMIGVMLSDVIKTDENEHDDSNGCHFIKCDVVKRCSMLMSYLIAISRQFVCMHKSDH